MLYTIPDYYHEFSCIAGKCEDTCCAGWQIVADEAALKKYKKVTGSFRKRLRRSINWKEGTFKQDKNKRCAFLNDENLCDMYTALGEKSLCRTCKMYPRHVEEFEDVREMTLSVSCPEVARILLGKKEPVRFLTYESNKEEEYDDFDPFLYSKHALLSIDLKTIFLFGGTLSLASALEATGAGELIADKVIGMLGDNPSPYILTFVIFMLCCIMTNFMSNTATTALMAPIGVSIAQGMGADPSAVLMACVIGGSCAFATPIGMPANTMVVTAGGYTFKDYAKAGIPMIVVATIVSMILLPIFYPFFP